MTESKRKKFLQKWFDLLRLNEWHIDVGYVEEFDNDSTSGLSHVYPRGRRAEVRIKKDLSPMEEKVTIIHELLHVRFPNFQFPDGSVLEQDLEIGVEVLAKLLAKEIG